MLADALSRNKLPVFLATCPQANLSPTLSTSYKGVKHLPSCNCASMAFAVYIDLRKFDSPIGEADKAQPSAKRCKSVCQI